MKIRQSQISKSKQGSFRRTKNVNLAMKNDSHNDKHESNSESINSAIQNQRSGTKSLMVCAIAITKSNRLSHVFYSEYDSMVFEYGEGRTNYNQLRRRHGNPKSLC